jgi:hypothetical protein
MWRGPESPDRIGKNRLSNSHGDVRRNPIPASPAAMITGRAQALEKLTPSNVCGFPDWKIGPF